MEKIMQYVWSHRLWPRTDMHTNDGRRLMIIDPGRLNTDSGPDFFNAKIRINGEIWVGNIEMHMRATDWHRHGHDGDPAYDNVILHVVDTDDGMISRPDGTPIPQMVMKCSPDLNRHYTALVSSAAYSLGCAEAIHSTEPVFMRQWLDSLFFERLHEKADRIMAYRQRFTGDWEQAAFAAIARALGVGINGEIFERLALNLPLKVAARHNDSVEMTDALVFGMSGLLDNAPDNEYTDMLRREYRFICTKFGLHTPQGMLWKMARMRPASLPHRRLALLSHLLHQSTRFMSRIISISEAGNAHEQYARMFAMPAEGFWASHYTFDDHASLPAKATAPGTGTVTLQTIMINAVVPLLYAYGTARSEHALTQRALDMVEHMAPERNSVVRMFTDAGIPCDNAADSQALVQLRKAYCEKSKCLYCRFGHSLLSGKAKRATAL